MRPNSNLLSPFDALAAAQAPRYTSYPTAAQFSGAVGQDAYRTWLAASPIEEPVSVYVHVPFCRQLCWYCGCNTRAVSRAETISDYIRKVERELELVYWAHGGPFIASALHLGGGSPDSLSVQDLDWLFASLKYAFVLPSEIEIAAELDPCGVTPAWIDAAARHGLSRASLGVQTFAGPVQAAINRPQPFSVVADVVAALRQARVKSINFDLMYGLPLQTCRDVEDTIDQALRLKPDRLSVFGYAHVPWMKAHQKLIKANDLPGVSERVDQAETAAARLIQAGYQRIGLDHFALPDDDLARASKEGRLHRNFQGYTTDQARTLIGLGASAISRFPQGYAQNSSDEVSWRSAISAGRLATARGVALTEDDRLRADIIERLMCDESVDLAALTTRHGQPLDALDDACEPLTRMARDGLIERQGSIVALTESGRHLVRTVCTAFDRYFQAGPGKHSAAI
jgi:oxygen-independent coproporphyrinogen-3 oxidase